MKRRKFVTGSIVAGAAVWLAPATRAAEILAGGRPARVAGTGSVPQATMTREWFDGLVGSTVELTQRDEPVRATVASVMRRPARRVGRNAPATDQFTVVFSLKEPAPLFGLCEMTSANGSRHEVFLGRVTDAGSRFLAQAHFSLLM